MPDANDSNTVAGVEPTVLVRYVGNPNDDSNDAVELGNNDNGVKRVLQKNGPAVYVTEDEYGQISGAFEIVKVEGEDVADDVNAPLVNQEQAVVQAEENRFPSTPGLHVDSSDDDDTPAHSG